MDEGLSKALFDRLVARLDLADVRHADEFRLTAASAPRLPDLWPAVEAWAGEPIKGLDDGRDLLLFESFAKLGPSHSDAEWYEDRPRFVLEVSRQLTPRREDGEDDDMQQVLLYLLFPADDDLVRLLTVHEELGNDSAWGPERSGEGGIGAKRWAASIRETPVFRAACECEPHALCITYGFI